MLPFLKRMLQHGVISFDAQGGQIDARGKQRPYLCLLIPQTDCASWNTNQYLRFNDPQVRLMDDLVAAGFFVFCEDIGLLCPPNQPSIVESIVRSMDEYVTEQMMHPARGEKFMSISKSTVLQYRIPLAMVCENDHSWRLNTSFPIGHGNSIQFVLGKELKALTREDAWKEAERYYQIAVIHPIWGADTGSFAKTISESVEKTYPRCL